MARKNRVWYHGAMYHVMARGVRRSAIFTKDDEYKIFLMIVKKIQEKFPFVVNSYCLMTNHFHMQITTGDTEIWIIMQAILNLYAKQFNSMHGYRGHMFEGRYCSCLIEDPVYFLEVSRYIHLNPVKAGIVRSPDEYEFSSYRAYIGNALPVIEDHEKVLLYFDNHQNPGEGYRRFVEERIDHTVYEEKIQEECMEDSNWLPC